MLGSELKTGIMICLSRKVKKRCNSMLPEMKVMTPMLRINQEWRIAHLVGAESETMRHSAEYRDKTQTTTGTKAK